MEQQLYQDQFSRTHDFPLETHVEKTLVIASTPRSGSHFLGHTLHRTQHFGFPLEYSNPRNKSKWEEIFDVRGIENILNCLKKKRTSPNGVFSIKAHYSHLPQFGGFKGFLSHVENPYFILLTREDLLKQAISLSIARQTGVWISGQEARSSDAKYDEKDIAFCLKRTILHNASWKYLLSTHNVKYMELTFEKARDNLPQAVDRIAEFMGLDVPVEQFNIEPATKKQSTAINNEWRERFLESKHQEILLDINLALGQKSKKTQLKELLFNKKNHA